TGSGDPILTPEGWQQNWFSSVDVTGARVAVSAALERTGVSAAGNHDLSATLRVYRRSMDGRLSNQTLHIEDSNGALVRLVSYGAPGRLNPSEFDAGLGLRDLWDLTTRLQMDFGLRLDGGGASQIALPAPRLGVRYLLDGEGRTTLRASAGR